MRIAIVGAGAVGGYLAAKLAAAGARVELVARGPQLEAVRASGLRVIGADNLTARLPAVERIADLAPCDLLITAVKAYAIPAIAPAIARALGSSGGAWLCAVNGLPWWYGEGIDGPLADIALAAVDPGGAIRAAVPAGRTLGCVVYMRSEVTEPGVVHFSGAKGLILGEPAGPVSPRAEAAVAAFRTAGLTASATPDIRTAVWNKVFGNVALNPLSALTGLTADRLLADPGHRTTIADVVGEAQALAHRLGCPPDMEVAPRLEVMASLGPFRTSTLQDAEAGRPLEHEAIIGAVVEIARRVGHPVPATERVYGDISQYARSRGLVPSASI